MAAAVDEYTHRKYSAAGGRVVPIAVCTQALNEAPYLAEWVHFHRRLGVDKFIVFADPASTDSTQTQLGALAPHGVVLVDWNIINTDGDFRTKSDSDVKGVRDQIAFVSACVRTAHEMLGTSWVFNLDVDEFLVFKHFEAPTSLVDTLGKLKKEGHTQALIARQIYGSAGELWPSTAPVTSRFTKRSSKWLLRDACKRASTASDDAKGADKKLRLKLKFANRFCDNYIDGSAFGKFAVLSDAVSSVTRTWAASTIYGTNVTCTVGGGCGMGVNHYQLKSFAEFLARTTTPGNDWIAKYGGMPELWFEVFDAHANDVEDDIAQKQLGPWYPSRVYDAADGYERPLKRNSNMNVWPASIHEKVNLSCYPVDTQSKISQSLAQCPASMPKAPAVILMGMHHSGTSEMASLLIRSGIYGGGVDDLLLTPKWIKFWEYAPAVEANQKLYVQQMRALNIDPVVVNEYSDRSGAWTGKYFNMAKIETSDLRNFMVHAARGVAKLSCPGLAFVAKDPRISLTAPLWANAIKQRASPVCAIMWRPAHKVSEALVKHGICSGGGSDETGDCQSLDAAELYELTAMHAYTALTSCHDTGIPTTLIAHASLANAQPLLSSTITTLTRLSNVDKAWFPDPSGGNARAAVQQLQENFDPTYFNIQSGHDRISEYEDVTDKPISIRAQATNLVLTTHAAAGPGSKSGKNPLPPSDVAGTLLKRIKAQERHLEMLAEFRACEASTLAYTKLKQRADCAAYIADFSSKHRAAHAVHPLAAGDAFSDSSSIITRHVSRYYPTTSTAHAGFNLPSTEGIQTSRAYAGLVWLAWTTDSASFGKMQSVVLQSILRHNPAAKVFILSNTLDLDSKEGDVSVIGRLQAAGYDLTVRPLMVDKLASFLPKYDPQNKYVYSHLTDVLRYFIIHKYGGVYLDFDMVVINPWVDMPKRFFHLHEAKNHLPPRSKVEMSRAAYSADEPYTRMLNTAFMRFEKGSSLLSHLLSACAVYHNPNVWASVGNLMVFQELERMRGNLTTGGDLTTETAPYETSWNTAHPLNDLLNFDMLSMEEVAPTPVFETQNCVYKNSKNCHCDTNLHRHYVFHLYGHVSTFADDIEPGSCLHRLITENIVFNEDAVEMLKSFHGHPGPQ